jgi:LysM repeat protein
MDAASASLIRMNKPNPLVPQGTFADKGRSDIRITVFAILAVHVVLLGVLLIAGCNKKDTTTSQGDPGLPPPVPPLTAEPTNPWPVPPTPANLGNTSLPVALPLPSNPPPSILEPPPTTASAFTEHTVMKGDSFYTLGKEYKVGYQAIADANSGLDPTKLKIGQKIKIPPPKPARSTTAAPGAAASAPMSASGEKIYSVKSGDTLIKIARAHGVTQKELQSANNLRTTQIRVGQKLKIPGKAPIVPPDAGSPPPGSPGLPPDGTGSPGTTPPPFR